MNGYDILILIAIAAAVIAAILTIKRNKGCCKDCRNCSAYCKDRNKDK